MKNKYKYLKNIMVIINTMEKVNSTKSMKDIKDNDLITFISSDNIQFKIPLKQIIATKDNPLLSGFIRTLFDDVYENTALNNTFQLQHIKGDSMHSDILKIVFEHCKLLSENPPKTINGTIDDVFMSIKDHSQYHLQFKESKFDDELIDCHYNKCPIQQTFCHNLVNDIRPKFIDYFSNLYTSQRNVFDDIWKHLVKNHSNGFCCIEDDKFESNNNFGKSNYIIPEWDRIILSPYCENALSLGYKQCILSRIYMAAEYFDLHQLREDVAHIISELIEKMSLEEMRKFFGEKDDLNNEEESTLTEVTKYLDVPFYDDL